MLLAGDSYGGVQSAELAMQGQQAQNYWNTVKTMQADAQFAKQVADQQRARDMAQQNFLAQVDFAQRKDQEDAASRKSWFDFNKTSADRTYGLQKQAQDFAMAQPQDSKSIIDAMNLTATGLAPDQAALAFNLPTSVVPRLAIIHNSKVQEYNDALKPAEQLASDLNRNLDTVTTFNRMKDNASKIQSYPWYRGWGIHNNEAVNDPVKLMAAQKEATAAGGFIAKFGENNRMVGLQGGKYVSLNQPRAFWTMPGANAPASVAPGATMPASPPHYPEDQTGLAPDTAPSPTPPPASLPLPMTQPANNALPVALSMPRIAPAAAGGAAPFAWMGPARAPTPASYGFGATPFPTQPGQDARLNQDLQNQARINKLKAVAEFKRLKAAGMSDRDAAMTAQSRYPISP